MQSRGVKIPGENQEELLFVRHCALIIIKCYTSTDISLEFEMHFKMYYLINDY